MKIDYYETNHGVFFEVRGEWNYIVTSLEKHCCSINGIPVEDIRRINAHWFKMDSVPTKILRKKPATKVHVGWTLIDPELASTKIPAELSLSELYYNWNDETEDNELDGEYKNIGSLYQRKYDELPSGEVEVEFEINCLGKVEIENFNKPEEMQIKVRTGSFSGKVQTVDLSSITTWDELDQLFTPEFMLHTRPCKLTSEQMYKIVRAYILDNINSKEARITSNYDFCFTVKKVLHKQSVVKKKDVEELFEVFEMTWAGYDGKDAGYKDYTPIKALEANNFEDLKSKLQKYLVELIESINAKVVKCQHCNGSGHIVEKISTNKGLS